jgi:hypothetical protein
MRCAKRLALTLAVERSSFWRSRGDVRGEVPVADEVRTVYAFAQVLHEGMDGERLVLTYDGGVDFQ